MKVSEIMTKNPITVQADDPVRDAAGLLRTHRIGGLPVMEGDRLAGIVTESDIIALLDTGGLSDDLWLPSPLEVIEVPVREFINWEKTKAALTNIGDKKVREIMSHPAISISEDAEIEDAASLMLSHRIARLPVVRDGRLIGIIARADIIRGIGRSTG
ncbi:MAG TPA: CBS domain-containing protein [Methanoregulaceae archaeon]|mgnify:FL=1|nr:MAG: CBS domain-containing protein [Methanolinea sp.]HON80745.1 CBS domain-containing protein [Methanoregulaceae archaeon]HPD09480.1 CBS domain-containing protein [Methanoregulaceae archaeon]HRT14728.1 CBS domain-containing protein [Methanoregulaceae archaeon]HRU30301.1 CBS domain-containing protein [Methanoregulaceae archaeon]